MSLPPGRLLSGSHLQSQPQRWSDQRRTRPWNSCCNLPLSLAPPQEPSAQGSPLTPGPRGSARTTRRDPQEHRPALPRCTPRAPPPGLGPVAPKCRVNESPRPASPGPPTRRLPGAPATTVSRRRSCVRSDGSLGLSRSRPARAGGGGQFLKVLGGFCAEVFQAAFAAELDLLALMHKHVRGAVTTQFFSRDQAHIQRIGLGAGAGSAGATADEGLRQHQTPRQSRDQEHRFRLHRTCRLASDCRITRSRFAPRRRLPVNLHYPEPGPTPQTFLGPPRATSGITALAEPPGPAWQVPKEPQNAQSESPAAGKRNPSEAFPDSFALFGQGPAGAGPDPRSPGSAPAAGKTGPGARGARTRIAFAGIPEKRGRIK